jgi:hypothetical protein
MQIIVSICFANRIFSDLEQGLGFVNHVHLARSELVILLVNATAGMGFTKAFHSLNRLLLWLTN